MPSTLARNPTSNASMPHRPTHLLRGGADGAQQRELAGALGHDHAEGVGDHEAADEQRQQREPDQHRLEEVGERGGVTELAVDEVVAVLDLDARRAGPARGS